MHITVAIATYNRAEELRLTLAGLARVGPSPGDTHDVIVVDNNSSDATSAVVEEASGPFGGRLRGLNEPAQGLSHARNRAIAESRGQVVAFLDDDVDVGPGWLAALCEAYRDGDVAAVGGRARLVYPVPRPPWIGDDQEGKLSRVDHGDRPIDVGPDDLFGVNLSVRRDWLDRVGPFRTDLGRVGRRLLGGEERDMLDRIASTGGRLRYEPRAEVGHRVAPERLRRGWFLRRAYWGAFGETSAAPREEATPIWLARYSWYAARATGRLFASALRHGPGSPPSFQHALDLAFQAGRCRAIAARLAGRGLSGRRPVAASQPARMTP
jgi:glycosyltransferase involved in cell wall biosynthesis